MAANALRAGFSFLQATELISKEMKAPMGTEFASVMEKFLVNGVSLPDDIFRMDDGGDAF